MNAKELFNRLARPPARRFVLIGAAAVGLFFILALALSPGSGLPPTAYYEVRRGTFTVSIVEAGNLAAVNEVSIRSEVDGTARVIYIVPEGSYVKKGDLLVELDSSQASDQVNQQEINFQKAQFALIQAQEQLEIERNTVESDIRAAELKLRFANMDLQKFLEGQRVVSLIEASNKLVQAEAQLAVNLETYSWTTNLAEKGFETKQRVDSDRLSVMNSRNSLIVASNTIWMLQEFDLRKQLEQYQSDVQEASNELQRVIARSKARIAQAEADLLTQSNTLTLNKNKLERDRKNLEATRIIAPQDGLVVYAVSENRFSSESLVEEGAVVRNRQELIKLPDTSRMKVTVKVHESHINMVRRGLPAFVILDSMPDVRFPAYVDRVALLPDTQARWGNPNLKVYNTDVVITGQLPDVKPGVSAKAEIVITNIANALSVPIQCVTTFRGRQVVYRLEGGDPTPVPVEVGMYNTKMIEITSGLKEGDRVLLSPPFDTQERGLQGEVLAPDEKAGVVITNAAPPMERPQGTRPRDREGQPDSTGTDSGAGRNFAGNRGEGGNRAPGGDGGNGPGGGSGGNRGGFDFAAAIREYDKDGDGELNDEERSAMRAAMQARFGAQAGGPGGGAQEGERPRFNREEFMKRYDTDGDGQLSEEERAAIPQFGGRRGGGPGGGGNRGAGGEGGGGPGRGEGARAGDAEAGRP